jgi:hypothetical protein
MKRGRRYCVLIEITYAGGRLPDDEREALVSAIRAHAGHDSWQAVVTVSPDPYSILAAGATLRAPNPRAALAELDGALDDALMATGLFEQFDVTGKVLRVAPLDQAYRIRQEPAGPATA